MVDYCIEIWFFHGSSCQYTICIYLTTAVRVKSWLGTIIWIAFLSLEHSYFFNMKENTFCRLRRWKKKQVLPQDHSRIPWWAEYKATKESLTSSGETWYTYASSISRFHNYYFIFHLIIIMIMNLLLLLLLSIIFLL